jgi:hypothetical protein
MRGIQKALNDASCLQGLNELSTMTVPLQSPNTWLPGSWSAALTTDVSWRHICVSNYSNSVTTGRSASEPLRHLSDPVGSCRDRDTAPPVPYPVSTQPIYKFTMNDSG